MEIIGVDHGYAAMKTTHYVFPSGVVDYGEHEPYTLQNTLLYNGKYYVCGSGRQPLLRIRRSITIIISSHWQLWPRRCAIERISGKKRSFWPLIASASFGRKKNGSNNIC